WFNDERAAQGNIVSLFFTDDRLDILQPVYSSHGNHRHIDTLPYFGSGVHVVIEKGRMLFYDEGGHQAEHDFFYRWHGFKPGDKVEVCLYRQMCGPHAGHAVSTSPAGRFYGVISRFLKKFS